MKTGKQDWVAVSRTNPCPICGKPDNCKISRDGGVVWCGRVESNLKQNAGGQWLHKLTGGQNGFVHPVLGDAPPHKVEKNSNPTSTAGRERLVRFFVAKARDRISDLANELGVDVCVLQKLRVGLSGLYHWTFPERDADGKVIGLSTRNCLTGRKGCMRGSRRGLTYADTWHEAPGPIYTVEGASDTAAMMTMGHCVIGRPNNRGGADMLGEMLKHHPNREIIVLGEDDRKEDGSWPGREGAIAVATKLANQLQRSIYWALPPPGFKDVREYLNAAEPKPPWALDLQEIGPTIIVEPHRGPSGPKRTLGEWREELPQARLRALEQPGLYFDGSPTGAGKSYADRTAMERAGNSLHLVPTHKNGDELVAELRAAGFEADKLPARTSPEQYEKYLKLREEDPDLVEWNVGLCENMAEVERAESFGLSAGAAVCPTCPFKQECDYLERRKSAMTAPHLVATHHMFARNAAELSRSRSYIAVHEDPEPMIRPLRSFSIEKIAWLQKVGSEGKWQQKRRLPKYVKLELIHLFDQIVDQVREIEQKAANANQTLVAEDQNQKAITVRQKSILEACDQLFQRQELSDREISPAAMEFLLGLLSGTLNRWAIRVDDSRQKGGDQVTHKSIVAVWKTDFPVDVTIVFSDATGNAEAIQELTGLPVHDITPSGHLDQKSSVCQVPVDIKRTTAESTVMGLLAAAIARHPRARKIGIIGHQPHMGPVKQKFRVLESREFKTAYFGEGTERASNEWHRECDLLIVLGTPRLPPGAIQDSLIRRGRLEALSQDGRWEPRLWEAETVSGDKRVIRGVGYAEPSWRRAHEDLVQAALLQAVGRARSYQESGIPVILFSNEPLRLPAEDEKNQTKRLSSLAVDVLVWMEDQIAKTLNNIYYSFCNFKTGELAQWMAIDDDRASKVLKELEEAGYVTKLSHGKWGVSHLLESSPGQSVASDA